jgi:hypothetical protein
MSSELLDIKSAARFCHISVYTLSQGLIRRTFPRPTIQNSRALFWTDELRQWVADNRPSDARESA